MVGRPARVVVDDVIWDDQIEGYFARHEVNLDDVVAVSRSDFLGFDNLPGRGGTHIMIGPDGSGRILYISIKPTATPGVWEPVTGWESRLARRIWANERGGQG